MSFHQATQKKFRWLDGYKFWRAQYILRSDVFLNLCERKEYLRNQYITKAKELLDKDTLNRLGYGDSSVPPRVTSDYVKTIKSLPKEVFAIGKEMSIVDGEIGKYFPSLHVPKIVDTDKIIDSIINSTFNFRIYVNDISDESIIYPGVMHSDLSRYVLVINPEQNKSRYVELKIDCSADIGHILNTVCSVIEADKVKNNETFESCKMFLDIEMETYLIKKRNGVAYNAGSGSDSSRAVGLWLYDYAEETGCKQAAAVSAIMERPFMKKLGKDKLDPDTLKRMHRQTKKCVERAEVLKIQ